MERCMHPDHRPPLEPGKYKLKLVDTIIDGAQCINMFEYTCPRCGQITSIRHVVKASSCG